MKKLLLLFFSGSLLFTTANAQKLPDVQEKSIRAPSNIRIDGKPDEWNNQFQAYNKTVELFYTMSNDNDKLYLTVQATDLDIINKVVCAGVTLTVNGSGKSKDQEGVSIMYPEINYDINVRHAIGPPITFSGIPAQIEDTEENRNKLETFKAFFNRELASKAKDIRIGGTKEISHPLISIYNTEGIKVAALIDNKRKLTYELAVPLKYLGISINKPSPFTYNIKLKGLNPDFMQIRQVSVALSAQRGEVQKGLTGFGNGHGTTITILEGPPAARLKELFSPTDFWGEYTLGK